MTTAPTRLAQLVTDRLDELRGLKTQSEIAREAGFKNPNIITMIKKGQTKLAIDRVPDLAKALDTDPALLLRVALEQFYSTTTITAMMHIFSGGMVTKNEMDLLNAVREATGNADPKITPKTAEKITEVLR